MTKPAYRIAALYKFGHIEDLVRIQQELKPLCLTKQVCGTLIVAEEGINGTIAGSAGSIETVLEAIRASQLLRYRTRVLVEEQPFFRMKVRHKPEIVTMGTLGADPRKQVGQYVEPEEWNALIQEPVGDHRYAQSL